MWFYKYKLKIPSTKLYLAGNMRAMFINILTFRGPAIESKLIFGNSKPLFTFVVAKCNY